MLNQEVRYRFSVVKNERLHEYLIAPGTPWEEIYAVLAEMSDEFKKLQEEAVAKEAEQNKPVPEVEAELVK